MLLEPIYAADFSRHSSGCRPNRSPKEAVPSLATRLNHGASYGWAIAGDMRACFDAVRHGKVMRLRRRRIQDTQRLPLGWCVLRAGCLEGMSYRPTLAGVPQGGINTISANLSPDRYI